MSEVKRQFLAKHKNSDELIYNKNTKELICAVYLNPEYTIKKERQQFFIDLSKIIIKEGNK